MGYQEVTSVATVATDISMNSRTSSTSPMLLAVAILLVIVVAGVIYMVLRQNH